MEPGPSVAEAVAEAAGEAPLKTALEGVVPGIALVGLIQGYARELGIGQQQLSSRDSVGVETRPWQQASERIRHRRVQVGVIVVVPDVG